MKKCLLKMLECLLLYKRFWKYYWKFFTVQKKSIYKTLKSHNITNIKFFSQTNWKLVYGSCYFKGKYHYAGKKTDVFIKVQSDALVDCFDNEPMVNQHIDNHSAFLAQRKPKLFFFDVENGHYFLVFEHMNIQPAADMAQWEQDLQQIIQEYTRIGVIHTDFDTVNLGTVDNSLCCFDYGTSLCADSDHIRIRYDPSYNHLDKITAKAKALMPDADFYYDDAVHCGMDRIDRTDINFLVGKENTFYAKLGDRIQKYHMEPSPKVGVLCLMKDDKQ